MAKFKQVPQSFLYCKLLEFWGNMVKNYRSDVQDDDFFDILRNCFDHEKAVELVEAAYSRAEIEEMSKSRMRSSRLDLTDSLDDLFQALWNHEKGRDKCRVVLDSIREYMIAECGKRDKVEVLEKRFNALKNALKLSDVEMEILLLAYVKSQTCFDWPRRVDDREKPLFYAMALDRSYGEVMKVMTPRGKLRKFGLLDSDWDFSRSVCGFMDGVDDEAIERRFYKKLDETDILPWEFFGELSAKDGTLIAEMLKAAKGKCNILLYGAPGTGKTSFAKALAKRMGLSLFSIKQGDDDGKNMKSEARMMGIQICNEQEDPKTSLMMIDEADELLRGNASVFDFLVGMGSGGKSTEKGVMNSILDEMKIPAIWISNAPAGAMDESVRRRFDYSICFERMNSHQRECIWRNVVAKHGLGDMISEDKIRDYAVRYETSAGGISTVLDNVKRMKPESGKVDELIAKLMKPHCKLMGVKESTKFLPAKDYSLDGLNIKGKVPLDRIVKAVGNYLDADFSATSEDKPRMNILMFGPPGSGKTEFCKYLGRELDRKVMVVKGSDIISKYVGETEQQIAAAFRRAEAERAILFFDEIDGLVQSRDNARASWEVTQVNELLQQMENFDGIMVAATNFCKNLDPAIMRRFTFKLEFGYLEDEGKRLFFERMFKTQLSDEEFKQLRDLRNLTPGDFRTVRQEQFYLGESTDNEARIAALKDECSMKRDGDKPARIGF